MTSDIIIMCTERSAELALELGLVYALMQTSTHILGFPPTASQSSNLAFFHELGGKLHDTDLKALLALYPTAQVMRL
jgi:hypothetical protein